METPPPSHSKADYGIDAPHVIRNLLLVAGAGFLLWLSVAFGVWSGRVSIAAGGEKFFRFQLGSMGLTAGLAMLATALAMLWASKVGKLRTREKNLDLIAWTGREQVLDVGCGRGLMLIGAARRLTTGKATGIDIWQSEDLSDNRPEAALENARRENVTDRVQLKTMDMRTLAFPDGTFDVILSCNAIHNVYAKDGRAQAIAEIARVLKPGGVAVIEDVRHTDAYLTSFAAHGCRDERRIGSRVTATLMWIGTFGSVCPGTILVRKTD